MRMPLTTRRSPRQPAPAGPLHAGRIARALVLLFLLLQALPLAHALLQQFDPPGICARNLAECLAIP